MLSERGAPTPVAWTRMRAPQSLMGPIEASALTAAVDASSLKPKYAEAVDRESAYEMLSAKVAGAGSPEAPAPAPAPAPAEKREEKREARPAKDEPNVFERVVESSAFRSMMRSAGSQLGREISRSLFGTARRRR